MKSTIFIVLTLWNVSISYCQTFERHDITPPNYKINSLEHPSLISIGSVLFIQRTDDFNNVQDSILYSNDDGKSWKSIDVFDTPTRPNNKFFSLNSTSSGRIVVAYALPVDTTISPNKRLHRFRYTDNYGMSWSEPLYFGNPPKDSPYKFYSLGLSAIGDGDLVGLCRNCASDSILFRYHNTTSSVTEQYWKFPNPYGRESPRISGLTPDATGGLKITCFTNSDATGSNERLLYYVCPNGYSKLVDHAIFTSEYRTWDILRNGMWVKNIEQAESSDCGTFHISSTCQNPESRTLSILPKDSHDYSRGGPFGMDMWAQKAELDDGSHFYRLIDGATNTAKVVHLPLEKTDSICSNCVVDKKLLSVAYTADSSIILLSSKKILRLKYRAGAADAPDVTVESSINIYPSENNIYVASTSQLDGKAVEIYQTNGRLVRSVHLSGNYQTVTTIDLAQGYYFARVGNKVIGFGVVR